jgi:uncharacterized protein (DUF433 family)
MAQLELPESEPLPLRWDPAGAVRVGKTKVTLDAVVYAFNNGCAAEEIMLQYRTLTLPDIYGALFYYLRHREQVDAYIAERRLEAEELRRKIEELCPPDGLRERLLARQAQQT